MLLCKNAPRTPALIYFSSAIGCGAECPTRQSQYGSPYFSQSAKQFPPLSDIPFKIQAEEGVAKIEKIMHAETTILFNIMNSQ